MTNIFTSSGLLSRWFLFSLLLVMGYASTAIASDELAYKLSYHLELEPKSELAEVTVRIDKGHLFRYLQFENLPDRYKDIKANGKLTISEDEVRWQPPKKDAELSLKIKITHERDPGEYDAMITKDWAIFRGDDLFPAMKTDFEDGAYAKATLEVDLPKAWTSIETGWPRIKGNRFRIDNPERKFDRPTGWMIAGKLGTRREEISKTSIAISAPKGSKVRRMDMLTFFGFVWPEVNSAFKKTPDKLLIVSMDDPMWRGGLSASNSLYLHADRPIVSENGTSPLLHELTHMVTRIRGVKEKNNNDDWIAEGLAEFYSFELLYRAGGMTLDRREKIISRLGRWGKDVKHLRKKNSSGKITARAVVLVDKLDKEIQKKSKNKYSIDDVTRKLMEKRKVSIKDLKKIVESLIGEPSKTLRSPLVN